MVDRFWLGIKLLLSATLVGAPLALLAIAPHALLEPMFIGVSSALLFLAALPWLNFTAPSRGLGLAGVFSSLAVALFAARTAFGAEPLPRACSSRRALLCELENLLYAEGGEYLAAAPWALLAVIVFLGSLRLLFKP